LGITGAPASLLPTNGTPAARATTMTEAGPLPGRGLAQHDFLYAGEDDIRRPSSRMSLIRDGKVAWSYELQRVNSNGVDSAFSDIHRLSNGDIVFAYQAGWRKIDKNGKALFDYRCPQIDSNLWSECHSVQPIGMDKVLFALNALPPKLVLYNIKTAQVEWEHAVAYKENGRRQVHSQIRRARLTTAGTYLVAHLDMGAVVEYDKDWHSIWNYQAPGVWHALRLKNGNTLISGNMNGFVREVNPQGETVWEVKDGDLPGIKIICAQQVCRLANGNTVFCNWIGKTKRRDWTKCVQVIEVTPDKKAAWGLHQWRNPDLGPATCIQLLDEPGNDEDLTLLQ